MENKGYRPYENAEEFMNDYIKHHGLLYLDYKGTIAYANIFGFTKYGVKMVDGEDADYESVFEYFLWADDKSPCGVKVEEEKSEKKFRPYKERIEFLKDVEKHGAKLFYKETERDYEIVSFDFITKDVKVLGFCQPFSLSQLFNLCLWADDHSPMGAERC